MIIKDSGMKISEDKDLFDHKELWADNFELIDATLLQKVSKSEQNVFDITSTPVSYYTTLELPLAKIMQGFYFSQNGKYMYAVWADGATPESFILYRLTSTGKLLDSMTLTNFGHGTVLGVEDVGTDTYFWSSVDGSTNLARFKYTAGAIYTTASTGVTLYSNFGSGEVVNPTIDGGYIYFCRNLGSGNSWRVEKRNLSDVKSGVNTVITQFNVPTTYLYLQGYCVDGDVLYWLSGDTNGTTYPIKLTSFNLLSGMIINDMAVNYGEGVRGVAEANYKEPEGVFLFKDASGSKSLFVGITTGDTVTRYNKVFAYHSVNTAAKFLGYKLQDVPMSNNPDWITAAYKNSAVTNWSYPLQYRKLTGGKVQLRGCIGGFATGAVVATLPFEYKPLKMQRRMVAGDGSVNASRVSIDNATGDISVTLGTSVTAVWLDLEFDINS